MKAPATLVLFTNYFPFHTGEEYLETELPYLVKQFDRVVIVPVMLDAQMEQTRQLPDTVTVVRVPSSNTPRTRLADVIRFGPASLGDGVARRQTPFWAVHHFAYDLYFASRGHAFWRRARTAVLQAIEGSDEVVIYSYWLYVTALAATALQREIPTRTTRMVSRAHRYDVLPSANMLGYLPLREEVVSPFDAVHPVAHAGYEELAHSVPDHLERISVRRLGVEGPADIPVRSHCPLNIVSCSSLKTPKRLPLLIAGLSLFAREGASFTWTHYGGSGPALAELRAEASHRLPQGSWRMVGHVPNGEVTRTLRTPNPSLFINVSSSEGVPVSIMEAMAAGLPVMATAAGGTPEIVSTGVNGVLLPVELDAHTVAQALQNFSLATDAEYEALSIGARTTWEQSWNAEQLYSSFSRELIATDPPGSANG
ncbi:glycosyltransferase [Janibacter indicus]|uniref:glycosyltransferase n=1 Tax=Janibacter indicus TaxID=857417 RepID=UPI003EBCFEBB